MAGRIVVVSVVVGLFALALLKAAPPDMQRTIWRVYFTAGLCVSGCVLLHGLVCRRLPLRELRAGDAWRSLALSGLFWPYVLLSLALECWLPKRHGSGS
jgi:hypothetical protein